jgi:hypothetical protein
MMKRIVIKCTAYEMNEIKTALMNVCPFKPGTTESNCEDGECGICKESNIKFLVTDKEVE